MKFNETDFTVFDFETTGLYPYAGDRICEVGAVRVNAHGAVVDTYHTLIDPRRAISYGAFRVNGITDEMVRGKPTIDAVLPAFMDFLDRSVLVAYNAGFDLGFLEYALGDDRSRLDEFHVIDALKLARRVFPHAERYNLGAVSRSIGIASAAEHRALADAMATWKVFEKELEILRADGVTDVESVALPRKPGIARSRSQEKDKLQFIERAIRRKERVSITYFSIWNNALTRRAITPHSLQTTGDTSYIIAHCHLRDELRNFRLDCVVDVWPDERQEKTAA